MRRFPILVCSIMLLLSYTAEGKTPSRSLVDLSKGNPANAEVKGGKFSSSGWAPTGPSDNIRWNLSQMAVAGPGYIKIALTNLNPTKQSTNVAKNQFIGLDESCNDSEKGVRVRFRMGRNYKQFKIEATAPGMTHWYERPIFPLDEAFDENKVYTFKVEWDTDTVRISLNDVEFYSQLWKVKGFCNLQIGETWYPRTQNIIGPVYKSIEYGLLDRPQSKLISASKRSSGCTQVTSKEVVNNWFDRQNSPFRAEFDVTPSNGPVDGWIGITNGQQSISTGFASIVKFTPSGLIQASRDRTFEADKPISYSTGVTYRFRVEIDPVNRTQSLFVTPSGKSEEVIGRNYKFTGSQGDVTLFNNWGSFIETGKGRLKVCNFRITKGSPATTVKR
jgi:hypothetical protein